MRRPRSWSFLLGLLVIATGAFQLGVHGPSWARLLKDRWAPTPDYAQMTTLAGGSLVLISTSTCPWCARTRLWLQQQGLQYRDCVLDQLPQPSAVLTLAGSREVPQLITAQGRVIGHDIDAFAQLIRADTATQQGNARSASPWACVPVPRSLEIL